MINYFQAITITHKKLDVEELEHFIIKHKSSDELYSRLHDLKEYFGLEELWYMTTCNRVLLIVYTNDKISIPYSRKIFEYINPKFCQIKSQNLDKIVDVYHGEECFRHVFEVASSIDSMVVGEREILRQLRKTYGECANNRLCADNMRLLEKCMVLAAKDVYTNTAIGTKPLSIVSLAGYKLRKYNLPKTSRIIFIGAGETNAMLGRLLIKFGFKDFVIFNRSLTNAMELSSELNARAFHLADLAEYDEGFDVLICSTGSTEAIINADNYNQMLNGDTRKKIIIDLSIPNNVDKTVSQLANVNYINIDHLRDQARENLDFRRGNIAAARILINTRIKEFEQLFTARQIEKCFSELPQSINEIKDKVYGSVFKNRIEGLDESSKILLNDIMQYMQKKCIAAPIKIAKKKLVNHEQLFIKN